MSNYTKTVNFATKDNLSPGNPLKIVKGTEIDTEYNNIATAVATKTDNSAAAITGGAIDGAAIGGTTPAAGAFTTLAASGTTTLAGALVGAATQAAFNTVSTTLNLGGAATAVNIGAATGTATVANTTLAAKAITASTTLAVTGASTLTGAVTASSTLAVTGAATLSSTLAVTGVATLGNGAVLGTPTSATLTNATGLPISTGVSGLGSNVATFLATPSSANLISAVTDETGTGVLVFATSPTLVTPLLGTPTSATLTNATGLPISTGVSGLGTGVATLLATPSSANLASAITDETGTGALVFATSPTLVTPVLGTPASGTLTNATGLPISTGVSGLGTGVATFLATPSSANLRSALTDETGTGSAVFATSPTLVTPLLGTPTSGVATNLTGLPLTTGVTGLLPVANGGTATATPSIVAGTNITVTGTWPNQTIAASGGSGTVTSVDVSGGTTGLTTSGGPVTSSGTVTLAGTLAVANGGTGQTSYTNGQLLIGNTTGNTLTKTTLTAGSGITITNGSGAITIASSGGSGDVVGPASSTANGVALFDGTTGKLLKDSSATDGLIHGLTVGRGAGAVSTNTVLGTSAFQANTTGSTSVVVGNQAGYTNSTGINSVFVGHQAGYYATGNGNSFFGTGAGGAITTGIRNTIIGQYDGNGDGLDIRTASDYAVISDGAGNRLLSTANGYSLALDGGAVPQTGTGITFPATQSASTDANTLDDYEEGSFTFTGTGFTTTPTKTAYYTKIGNQVTIRIPDITGTSNTTLCTITGLPVAIRSDSSFVSFLLVYNNSTGYNGHIYGGGTNTIQVHWDAGESAFTASVIKGIINYANFTYTIV